MYLLPELELDFLDKAPAGPIGASLQSKNTVHFSIECTINPIFSIMRSKVVLPDIIALKRNAHMPKPLENKLEPGASEDDQTLTRKRLSLLSLAALGVVYGDIGTSPLYAMGIDFHVKHMRFCVEIKN